MAKLEWIDEPAVQNEAPAVPVKPVDVLIGITGEADPARLRAAIAQAGAGFDAVLPGAAIAVARLYVGGPEVAADPETAAVRLLTYQRPHALSGNAPWLTAGATYASLFALARTSGARASVIVNADLAALGSGAAAALAAPVLAGECELAMPLYAQGRFDGLLNAGVLAPLTRALYGKRVRYPLALDFAVAPALLPVFEHPSKRVQAGSESLFWPATEAAIRERKVCQVYVDVDHATVAEGIDLTTVLTEVLGPLFADMEANATQWQRVRGSHAVPVSGAPFAGPSELGGIDTAPMVEAFRLATRNLQDVWSLVLPPATQLELRRLARAPAEQFRLPDSLWAGIVYDFALAHRLKTLSRSHLMGAFAPIYRAWVASYVGEVARLSDAAADARLERLSLAYETGKPYLLSRWRWPDRFNP